MARPVIVKPLPIRVVGIAPSESRTEGVGKAAEEGQPAPAKGGSVR